MTPPVPGLTDSDMEEVAEPLRRCTEALGHLICTVIDYAKHNSRNYELEVQQAFRHLGDQILVFIKEPDELDRDLLDNNHDDTYPEEEDI
jgi:hypothetical protein